MDGFCGSPMYADSSCPTGSCCSVGPTALSSLDWLLAGLILENNFFMPAITLILSSYPVHLIKTLKIEIYSILHCIINDRSQLKVTSFLQRSSEKVNILMNKPKKHPEVRDAS
jgi:hypothetical protein